MLVKITDGYLDVATKEFDYCFIQTLKEYSKEELKRMFDISTDILYYLAENLSLKDWNENNEFQLKEGQGKYIEDNFTDFSRYEIVDLCGYLFNFKYTYELKADFEFDVNNVGD